LNISFVAGPSGARTHTVQVRNPIDGRIVQASHTVFFVGSHLRTLYSEELVSEFASWGFGKRVDRIVNDVSALPYGCAVHSVKGLMYREQNGNFVPDGSPVESIDNGNNGFTVSRPGGLAAEELEALAHVWHDGSSALRMRVVYQVWEPDGGDCWVPGATRTAP
jgi:hypothetical protein